MEEVWSRHQSSKALVYPINTAVIGILHHLILAELIKKIHIFLFFFSFYGIPGIIEFIKFSTSVNAYPRALIGSLNVGYQLIYRSLTLYGS